MDARQQGQMPISPEVSARLQWFLQKKGYSEGEMKVKGKLERILVEVDQLHGAIAMMKSRVEEAFGNITKKAGQVELLLEVLDEAPSSDTPQEEPLSASDPGQQD